MFQLCHRDVWVRIVFLVVLALRGSGGSCSTCCVEIDFTENVGHFLHPSGTLPVMGAMMMVLPSGSIGIYVHIRAYWLRAIPSLTLWAVSAAVMVSPLLGFAGDDARRVV